MFSCLSANNIDQLCTFLQILKINVQWKVDIFLMGKGKHIVNLKKQQQKYVTVLILILYSI